MSFYQKIVGEVLFPLHEKLKGHDTIEAHRKLERTQWLPTTDIASLQLENLRRFLAEIAVNVPYYQRLFAELKFDPQMITSVADLQRLPLLDKTTIRQHTSDLKAQDATTLKRFNTGGSTGEPLIFYLGNARISHDVAAKRRATRWWGVDIGDPEIVIWGSPIELGSQDRVRLLRDKLFRSEMLPAFEMSESNLSYFVDRIKESQPAMLFGYPSSLALIAEHARRREVVMNRLGIKVAFVTSERLYDHQRSSIEQVFGCPVANGYGARDAGFLAHECPEGSLHLSAEDIVVEIVDSDGKALPTGESGEIVVTHTATSEFPFVRYRTGDVGALSASPCSCGRGLPVLARVEGRANDFVVAFDGTVMHGAALTYVLRDMADVKAFQIIQDSLLQTKVNIVVAEHALRTEMEKRVRKQLRQRLGAEVNIVVSFVSNIPREKSGKYRYVISKISADYR